MKFRIKPEQVYIVVFCFFVLGAGCKAVGEFAVDKFQATAAIEMPLQEAHQAANDVPGES